MTGQEIGVPERKPIPWGVYLWAGAASLLVGLLNALFFAGIGGMLGIRLGPEGWIPVALYGLCWTLAAGRRFLEDARSTVRPLPRTER